MKNLFADISPKSKEKLFKIFRASTVKFTKGINIISYMDRKNTIGIIEEGSLDIIVTDYEGNITLIDELKENDIFGSMIYSAVSASSSVGVDIEAEQRCVNSISPIYTLFSLLRLLTTFKWVSQIGAVQRMLCGARKSKALLAFPYEVCFP